MSTHIDALVKSFLQATGQLGESEQHVVQRFTQRLHVSRNMNREFDETLSFGQQLADRIAAFVGSWTFILLFIFLLLSWVVLNTFILTRSGKAFDVYPYILLNLMLSMLAALQAPLIMMSQNRQAAKDRLEAEHDYEINLKTEMEVAALQQKLDMVSEGHLAELVMLQQEQIRLLTELLSARGSQQTSG